MIRDKSAYQVRNYFKIGYNTIFQLIGRYSLKQRRDDYDGKSYYNYDEVERALERRKKHAEWKLKEKMRHRFAPAIGELPPIVVEPRRDGGSRIYPQQGVSFLAQLAACERLKRGVG